MSERWFDVVWQTYSNFLVIDFMKHDQMKSSYVFQGLGVLIYLALKL